MPELLAVLEAYRTKVDRDRRFAAAIQGIELGDGEGGAKEFEEAWKEAMAQAAKENPKTEEESLASVGISYETA